MSQDTCANPLLLGWVKEWWDTAREQNSKGVTTYKHAYDSLRACPIAFDHPSSLQQLKGFGPKLCERLTEKLRKHCEENGTPMPAHPGSKKRGAAGKPGAGEGEDDDADAAGPSRPAKKARKPKTYVPTFRSGAYALVVALSSAGEDDVVGMTKAELIQEAQPHCDASFSAPADPTKFYTAWNSMKTLVQKELVYERGRPLKRYALTDEGWEVAGRIREAAAAKAGGSGAAAGSTTASTGSSRPAPPIPSANPRPAVPSVILLEEDEEPAPRMNNPNLRDVVASATTPPSGTDLPTFTPITLPPGTFTIELILDTREVRAKTDRDYMQQELAKQGITPTVRALELGDAMWVARCKTPGYLAQHGGSADDGDEVVLDWIVERKRLDDLLGSLRDGRFHEQKFRLRRSGVPNVVYLVEEISMDAAHFQRYEEAVQSALAAMQVVNGYFVKRTVKMDETIRYLAALTGMLREVYGGRALSVIPTAVLTTRNYLPLLGHLRETRPGESHHVSYAAFASLASKSSNMALRDLFLKMLMCTKGVMGEKAMEIQRVWKTPNGFVKAYEGCGEGEEGRRRKMELVSSRLGHLVARKKIGKPLSQKLAEVWADL